MIIDENYVRGLIREALDSQPIMPNAVVDPSASVTDPINPDFVPNDRQGLEVAFRQLTKDVPIDKVPSLYRALKDLIDDVNEDAEEEFVDKTNKKTVGGEKLDDKVEETVRRQVRKMISEINPRFDSSYSGIDYGLGSDDDDDDDDLSSKPKRAFKTTAIGNMNDVGGAEFDTIAKELGFSVSGAKQAVDKALDKARWLAKVDPDERELIVLHAMNDYIALLQKTGELTDDDVKLMRAHPDVVRELDGFREFLHGKIKAARKEDPDPKSFDDD